MLETNFRNGVGTLGLNKAVDLHTGRVLNADTPWWSLPEAMRAATAVHALATARRLRCRRGAARATAGSAAAADAADAQAAAADHQIATADRVLATCHHAFVSGFVRFGALWSL
jgi:hypothetical protein